ncbi:MAG TPA: ASCH domain-containing protein [Gaiellaceae bacterium]|nr:ASCH domain-containing protein [Gaiellaceae bacterium]
MGPARVHALARAPRRAGAGTADEPADGGSRPLSDLPPFELGYARTELRRELVDAVLRGEKTATAGLAEDEEPVEAGDRFALLDFDDQPVAVVEVTEARVVPAGAIDVQFARDEGEGFESVEDWRDAHERFFERPIPDDLLISAVRFRLVEHL